MYSEKANANLKKIETEINIIIQKIQKLNENYIDCSDQLKIKALYEKLKKYQSNLNALILAKNIQQTLKKRELNNRIRNIIQNNKLINQGIRSIKIVFPGNIKIPILTIYYSKNKKSKKKKGFYLDLLEIGIYNKYLPIFISEISMLVSALSSFEEVQKILEIQGYIIDIKIIRQLVKDYAKKARFIQKTCSIDFKCFNNYRIVIAMDGGRIRIRRNIL